HAGAGDTRQTGETKRALSDRIAFAGVEGQGGAAQTAAFRTLFPHRRGALREEKSRRLIVSPGPLGRPRNGTPQPLHSRRPSENGTTRCLGVPGIWHAVARPQRNSTSLNASCRKKFFNCSRARSSASLRMPPVRAARRRSSTAICRTFCSSCLSKV